MLTPLHGTKVIQRAKKKEEVDEDSNMEQISHPQNTVSSEP